MKRTFAPTLLLAVAFAFFAFVFAPAPALAQDEDETPARKDTSKLVRQLTDRDPLVRQRAAEELAEARASEHLRLVEGYRLQEKAARVRVALDWALYRMGRKDSLFDLVRALNSSRSDQAQVYLSRLETPEPLYVFLERADGNTQIKLLGVLAYVGDASTLERVAPLARSLDPKVAEAARAAADEISKKLAPPAPESTTRRQPEQEDVPAPGA
ncbi:MAG TPA: hypothetical protein VGV38_11640 [Pyrinomonadaceae bacterium]|nr:hypothetical protein [Pyrinomonadaceae bacterium]